MKTYSGFTDPKLKKKKRCLAIGIFDGVHRAHAKILQRALSDAKKLRARPMLVTFDPHPQKVLSGDRKNPPIIMSLEHRLRTIAAMGFKEAVVMRFTRAFAGTSRETFVEMLTERMGMAALSVGHDFRFGRRALGNISYLAACARERGFALTVCAPVKSSGRVISSTVIRRLIEKGKLREAGKLLGRPVSVYGTVVRGRGRGRGLGFPTANLDPHHETLPPEGVYAVRGKLGKKDVRGVLHIGKRPTFGDREKSVEAHLFGQQQDLYGREMELFFVARLRGIRRFRGPQELSKAIAADARRARRLLR